MITVAIYFFPKRRKETQHRSQKSYSFNELMKNELLNSLQKCTDSLMPSFTCRQPNRKPHLNILHDVLQL